MTRSPGLALPPGLPLRAARASLMRALGGGTSIGRYFLHILDAIPCWLGFLRPLWDAKRHTWADKIGHSVVIRE